ncbi:MAG: ion transporter [Treponema sp.]|nr:ion transporter [Treponema sp.]
MNTENHFLTKLRRFVDGEADTPFEYLMLLVVIVNTVVLGLETSPSLAAEHGDLFFLIDQICLWIFIAELLIKFVAFNKNFFGETRVDKDGEKSLHVNKWNIFDLIIVLVSLFVSLPFFCSFQGVQDF